ncbi:hypothetical protein [Bradyrhizobium sp. CCBAU 53340]|uniref:hypothetical protein n=1 Tax=Bradyrhizobium sp. CCBAU 53340 TaxID=1325112 RepID=UPI00188A1C48|nr:hypothetical protein [Bradyrhizobium sp. CCBAU 53340]
MDLRAGGANDGFVLIAKRIIIALLIQPLLDLKRRRRAGEDDVSHGGKDGETARKRSDLAQSFRAAKTN